MRINIFWSLFIKKLENLPTYEPPEPGDSGGAKLLLRLFWCFGFGYTLMQINGHMEQYLLYESTITSRDYTRGEHDNVRILPKILICPNSLHSLEKERVPV